MKKTHSHILIFFILTSAVFAQVEYVNITNPVYQYLQRAETMGSLPHFSLVDLPLQRYEIVDALKKINTHRNELKSSEQKVLDKYLAEFGIAENTNAVIIYSPSDKTQLFSKALFSDAEKMIYHYANDLHKVRIEPLVMTDFMVSQDDANEAHYAMLQVGGRVSGTLSNCLGYSIQATNGFFLSGDKSLAKNDPKYRQNIKFVQLDSDMDFTNSHVIYKKDWFYASLEREERLMGAGLNTKVFVSRQAPAYDAANVGVKFKWVDYKFTFGGLIGNRDTSTGHWATGYGIYIPPKYLVMHRIALQPAWGEFGLWEATIYSDRPWDLAYMNPLSFLKSVEHSLRDRDNSIMGADMTIRPIKNLEIKGSFLLDDLIFSEIGTDYWSNKTAWNISAMTTLKYGFDIGYEYSKVDPFTYTHFNNMNSYTNDSLMIGGSLLPNSDKSALLLNYWYGERYPIQLNIGYVRHGKNLYDEQGKMIKNVGADPNIGHDGISEWNAPFLDGKRDDYIQADISAVYELSRGISIGAMYRLNNFIDQERYEHIFRLMFKLNEF